MRHLRRVSTYLEVATQRLALSWTHWSQRRLQRKRRHQLERSRNRLLVLQRLTEKELQQARRLESLLHPPKAVQQPMQELFSIPRQETPPSKLPPEFSPLSLRGKEMMRPLEPEENPLPAEQEIAQLLGLPPQQS